MLRSTILPLFVVSKWCSSANQCDLMSLKWWPSVKKYESLLLLWFRSGAPILRSSICCRCLRIRSGAPVAKKYDICRCL